MPYVRGVRDYCFYNDEDEDHDMSVEEIENIRLSRVPAYTPATTLAPVVEALRNLGSDADLREEPRQFVAEDEVLLSDMSVEVDGVGELGFPLTEDTIDKLLAVKCTAEPRDCHVIPASEIKVQFKEEALDSMVKIISDSLNIEGKCSVKFDIRCLTVYGAGQYCGPQKANDKPVRLEVVLPSHCEGGNLYVKHGSQTHQCSGAGDSARWLAYYSDCARRVSEVREGHRVVLCYDVELDYLGEPEPWSADDVDVRLNDAVAQHFRRENRLLVLLLHRYSEDTLDWRRVKGRDSTYARALLAVAESQGLCARLAWGTWQESWETSGYHGPVRNGGSVELHCWVDESGRREKRRVSLNYEGMAREVCTAREGLWVLDEPDREVRLCWYGEGPAIREQWYNRAAVVLVKK